MRPRDTVKLRNEVLIKFVKKAGMWCKTYWDGQGAQKQEWSIEKPTV